MQQKSNSGNNDTELRNFLGKLLRIGVMSTLFVSLAGLLLFIIQHPKSPADFSVFAPESFSFKSLFNGLVHLKSTSIMVLGVVLLVLTPILQILLSMIGFIKERDRLYTFFALLVLLIIILSTFLGAIS